MSMSTAIFSRLLGDFYAAAVLVCSIAGCFYLAAHHRLRYGAPLLILAGVAFCSLVLDVSSSPPVLAPIGTVATTFAIVAGLLLIVFGDIALWRLLATSLLSRDFYVLILVAVSVVDVVLILAHEPDNSPGFLLLADLALVCAGMLVPVSMTVFKIMRVVRAAKRARTTP